VLGVVGGGGTLALWNETTVLNAGVIVPADGEASLRFAVGDPTSATAGFTNLLPGESKTIPVLLENDGDFGLNLSAELTATTGSGYALRLKLDDACTTSGFLSSLYLTDPAFAIDTPTAVGSINADATRKLCVQITADSGIVPSSAMTFDVTISGDSGS
jgi:predicted ribosomally synthesized peptide with SipW-like signal peptide